MKKQSFQLLYAGVFFGVGGGNIFSKEIHVAFSRGSHEVFYIPLGKIISNFYYTCILSLNQLMTIKLN